MRRRWFRRPPGRILGLFLIALLAAVILFASAQMRTLLGSLAATRAANTVNRIVSEAVNAAIDEGTFDYDKLISFEKDNDGKVTAVKSDMPEFNRLQSQILDIILTKLDEVSTRELSIPIGSLTGSSLLSGRGPCITVRMQSVGSSEARLENSFTAAGINQTRHQIILTVDVSVSILLPGFSTATVVSNTFVVAETIIVGSVPDTYTYFATPEEAFDGDAKDYVLNNG